MIDTGVEIPTLHHLCLINPSLHGGFLGLLNVILILESHVSCVCTSQGIWRQMTAKLESTQKVTQFYLLRHQLLTVERHS